MLYLCITDITGYLAYTSFNNNLPALHVLVLRDSSPTLSMYMDNDNERAFSARISEHTQQPDILFERELPDLGTTAYVTRKPRNNL